MIQFPSVWVENSPESLLEISLRYCLKNQQIFTKSSPVDKEIILQENLSFPVGICERIICMCKSEMSEGGFKKIINFFKDTAQTHLRCLDLSNCAIDDQGLAILTKHKICALNIANCRNLTYKSLPYITRLSSSLVSLTFGSTTQIFSEDQSLQAQGDHQHHMGLLTSPGYYDVMLPLQEDAADEAIGSSVNEINLPLLRKLVVHEYKNFQNLRVMDELLGSTCNLTYVDLSSCYLLAHEILLLGQQSHLSTLILCDVSVVGSNLNAICQLKSLRKLDISNSEEDVVIYSSPNKTLKSLVDSLENLESLDISGTNLAGSRTRERESSHDPKVEKIEENLTDIPGLASRVNRPLEFLGLLNTAYDACYRHHIPAKLISGDATEEQILIAGQIYSTRERMIQKVLNDLFQIFRFSTCKNTKLALDVIMEAMGHHPKDKNIQVSGSASLFYIVKGEDKKFFNIKMRRKIIRILIDAMCAHYSDITMLRNACLTLIHFKIPEDVFFDYKRLVSLLLLVVAQPNQDDFVQRIGLYLLNSLACQVDGFNKKLVGDHGAITIMLQLIEKRLSIKICDEVMETAWSTMWNVTDETPVNCARFLEEKGMDLFIGCLQAFSDKPELLRNMMGLLGNVAEVKTLRPYLMKDEYLAVFSDLLESKSDGIEVSYNAAGILSHIASDGEEFWTQYNIFSVKRKVVLQRMVNAIENWNLNTRRNINYRSFEPILRLLNVEHTPEVQFWATWALANLTRVYPDKYCTLLKEEGGIEMLKQILLYQNCTPQTSELASCIIRQCERFENGDFDDVDDITDITEVS